MTALTFRLIDYIIRQSKFVNAEAGRILRTLEIKRGLKRSKSQDLSLKAECILLDRGLAYRFEMRYFFRGEIFLRLAALNLGVKVRLYRSKPVDLDYGVYM